VDTVPLLAGIGALAAVVAVILAAVQHRKNGWIVTADCAGFNTYRSGGRQINRPAIEIAVRNEGRTPVSVSALIAKFATSHAPPIVLTLEPDWLLTPFDLERQQIASGQTRSWTYDVEKIAASLAAHPQFESLSEAGTFAVIVSLGSNETISTRLENVATLPTFQRDPGSGAVIFRAPMVGTLDLDRRGRAP